MFRKISLALLSAVVSLSVVSVSLEAKNEEWQDIQGTTFKGEPVDTFGPFIFFRSSATTGRRLLFSQLSQENCVRAYNILKNKSVRASDWSQAKGIVSADIYGNVMKPQGDKLVPLDLKGRAEPAIYVILFVSNGDGGSWGMLDAAIEPYKKLVQDHPGLVEMLMVGVRHSRQDQTNMACAKNVPFLVAEHDAIGNMSSISRFSPSEGYSIVVLSREGVLIGVTENPDYPTAQKTIQAVGTMIANIRPENPKTWAEQMYYQKAIQPVIHAADKADPMVIGTPIRLEVLRQRKLARLDASIHVDANGKVTQVEVQKTDGMSDKLHVVIGETLKQAFFVPAIDHGKFVDGVFEYHVDLSK